MKKTVKEILIFFDDTIFRNLVKWIYPKYKRQRIGYMYNFQILKSIFSCKKFLDLIEVFLGL